MDVAGVELVAAADDGEAGLGKEVVEEGEVEIAGDGEDVVDADLDEAAGEVAAEGGLGEADGGDGGADGVAGGGWEGSHVVAGGGWEGWGDISLPSHVFLFQSLLMHLEPTKRTKNPKKSGETVIKDWFEKKNVKGERVVYTAEFVVDSVFGEPGAITVANRHQKEFFLETIVVEGFPCGPVHFPCNS